MSHLFRVLLVEDNPGDAALVGELLLEDGSVEFEVECEPRLATAVKRVTEDRFDGLLLDLSLPDSTGIDTVRAMRKAAADLPIVVITGNGDEQTGMAAITEGAQDYVVKGMVSATTLSRVLRYAAERVESARRLRESEEREREILAHGGVGVYYWDLDGRLLLLNQRAAQNLGGSNPPEFMGKSLTELFGDRLGSAYLERIRDVGASAVSREYEDCADMPTGPRWYSSVWTRSQDAAGNVVGVHAYAYDITERRQMEESLRRTQFSVDHSRDLVHWLSPEGRFLYVNDSSCRRLGYSREELLSMTIFDVDPIAPQPWCSHFQQIRERGSLVTESLHQTKDGEVFPVEVTASYVNFEGQEYSCASARDITERQQSAQELRQAVARLARLVDGIIRALGSLVEQRDPYTAGHQQRVAGLACAIGAQMGLAPQDIEGLRTGALLHDIGKVAVPAEVLSKSGGLSSSETEMIKAHPEAGYQILKDIEFPWPVAQMVRQHHERMDGSGYPLGIKGADILLEARILAVADVVEAMASHRPYRPALGLQAALAEVSRRRGLFDRKVVRACVTVFDGGGFSLESAGPSQAPRRGVSAHSAQPAVGAQGSSKGSKVGRATS